MNRVERIKYRGSELALAGIVISRTPMGNLHVGIAHRIPAGPLHILHLAWDCKLEDDLDGDNDAFPYPLYVITDIDPEDEEVVSGLCRRIFETASNHKISYTIGAFPFPDSYFDAGGIYRSSDSKIGLNCATFVIKVFSAADLELVDVDGWPARPERDVPAQEWLVSLMERHFRICQEQGRETTLTREKIDFNREEFGKRPRVAPEEVAGAGLEPREDRPVPCDICQSNGELIVACLSL
jgi:hypothetical protein